jgi:FkbM family methyltransferase
MELFSMKSFTSNILRFLIFFFVTKKYTYLLGMVLLRFSRKLRKKYFNPSNTINLVQVNNCMGNIKMELDANSYMGGSLFWSGFHHLNECLYLNSFLTNNMVLVDVGANQGEFSLFAASKIKGGKVLSFEPVSSNVKMLKKNIALNNYSQIELFEFGLLDEETDLPVYTSNDEILNSGRHEGLSTLYPDDYRSVQEEIIQLKVFDSLFFEKLERLDFIKIDIEGAELPALKGMLKTITKFKPQILIEISSETIKNTNYEFEELLEFFEKLNYQAYSLFRGNLVKENDLKLTSWGNYIFI